MGMAEVRDLQQEIAEEKMEGSWWTEGTVHHPHTQVAVRGLLVSGPQRRRDWVRN